MGAALLLEGGEIVQGANIENASYREYGIMSTLRCHNFCLRAHLKAPPLRPCVPSSGTGTVLAAGICAERTALVKAATSPSVLSEPHAGDGKTSPLTGRLRAIAVSSDLPASPCSPCGICRQFIREFATLSTPVLMVWKEWAGAGSGAAGGEADPKRGLGKNCHDEKGVVVKTLGELLPLSFGPEELEKV